MLECKENKEWFPVYRKCPDSLKQVIRPAEAKKSVEIGSLAIGLLVSVFTLIVLFDILTICKPIKMKKSKVKKKPKKLKDKK